MSWIRIIDRPLVKFDEKGKWQCTEDGDNLDGFLCAVKESVNGWWIRHCVIEDRVGLCVVGEEGNEIACYEISDVSYWMPLPEPPKG